MKQICLLAVIACSLISCASPVRGDGPDKTNWELKTPEDAANRAIANFPGADKAITVIAQTAQLLMFANDQTPYIRDSINGRWGWSVEIDAVINLTRKRPVDPADDKIRKFTVLLDSQTGRLVRLSYVFSDEYQDKTPSTTGDSAQQTLANNREVFHGFPKDPPTINFTEALNFVVGSPYGAKEIYAWYLLYSRRDEEPHPVWYIDMRGVDPPYPSMSRYGANTPAKYRNNMRCVIDATTGQNAPSANFPVWSVTGER